MSPDSGCNDPVSLAPGSGERAAKGAAQPPRSAACLLPCLLPCLGTCSLLQGPRWWHQAPCLILASPCPTFSSPALPHSQHCSRGTGEQVLLQRAQCTGKGDELPAPGCAQWPPGHPRWLQDTPSPVPFPWQMKWGCLVLCASLVHQDGVARSSESKVKKPPLVMGG